MIAGCKMALILSDSTKTVQFQGLQHMNKLRTYKKYSPGARRLIIRFVELVPGSANVDKQSLIQ
jgi:hypothetical protein